LRPLFSLASLQDSAVKMAGWMNIPDGHPAIISGGNSFDQTDPQGNTHYTLPAAADADEERKRKRSTNVLASEDAPPGTESFAAYYCFACGSFALAVEGWLYSMPKRKTDNATVVPKSAAIKNLCKAGECKSLKRPTGVETQYRWQCPSCSIPIAYQTKDWDSEDIDYIYVLDAALAINPSAVSRLWVSGEDGVKIPPCFRVEEASLATGGMSVTIPVKTAVSSRRFALTNLQHSLSLNVTAAGGEEMRVEVVKGIAKLLGCSTKQVKISVGQLTIREVPAKDIFRRLICAIA